MAKRRLGKPGKARVGWGAPTGGPMMKKSVGKRVNEQRKGGGGGKSGLPWFAQPLTGKRFKRERRAAEREEFGPTESQLRKERAASVAAEADIGNYYNDYQQRLANLASQVSGAYGAANQQTQNLLTTSGQQEDARMAQIQAAAAADAQKRGVDVDPTVSQRGASAQAARAHLGQTFGALLASQGATDATHFANLQRIGGREGIGARAREAARRSSISSDERELAREKAQFRRGYRAQVREGEREFHLASKPDKAKLGYNKAIVKQARLGLKGEKVSAKAQQGVAKTQQETQKVKNKGFKNLPSGGGGKKKRKPKGRGFGSD